MKTELVSASTGIPLSLEDIKMHLRLEVGYTDEDDYLTSLRDAAMNKVETITNRKLLTQTWYAYYDKWPKEDYIKLPYAPLQGLNSSSTALVYWDSDRTTNTVSSTEYRQDTVSEPGKLMLEYNEEWPSETLHTLNPIRVEFVAGYGEDSSDIPAPIKLAMKVQISHYYESREPYVMGSIAGQSIEPGDPIVNLLQDYRIWEF